MPEWSSSMMEKKKSTSSFLICGSFSTRFVSFTNSSKVGREMTPASLSKANAAFKLDTRRSFLLLTSFLIEALYSLYTTARIRFRKTKQANNT